MMMSDAPVIVSREGSLGRLHLNRPKALNSLTLEMVRLIDAALTGFEADDRVACILITGEGERGLCAGGDIIALYGSITAGDGQAIRFWAEEYRLNARMGVFAKPYVAFMDGITMGGGVGVSVHGSHRIVTERTRLAMPETGIGFFPDVGVTWLLGKRSPGEVGTYVGLTGASLDAGDAIYAGFADAYMPADRRDALIAALAALPAGCDDAAVTGAIGGLSEPVPAAAIARNRLIIDATFNAATVEGILAALAFDGSAFAQDTLTAMATKSPTGQKVALSLLRAARGAGGLRDCLALEYTAARFMLDCPDFREGVRAAVIDKDRNPKWMPASLTEVALPPLHPDPALFT